MLDLKMLYDMIVDNIMVDPDDLNNEKLMNAIVNLDDFKFFFFVEYIEKIDGNCSYHLRERKKEMNHQLIESYDPISGLFPDDKEFIQKCVDFAKAYEEKENLLKAIHQKREEVLKHFDRAYIQSIEYDIHHKKQVDIELDNSPEYTLLKEYIDLLQRKHKVEHDYGFKEFMLRGDFDHFKNRIHDQKTKDALHSTVYSYSSQTEERLKKILSDYNVNKIRALLISNIYEDNPDNFIINLKTMLHFQLNNKMQKNIIPPEFLKIYQTILSSLTENNSMELISLYHEMINSNIDYKGYFYDHYNETRTMCAKMLLDSVYRIDENSDNYKLKDGVKCYELDAEDEKFFMMIHTSSLGSIDFDNKRHDAISMSFISNDRLQVYSRPEIIYGFSELNPKQLLEIYHMDAGTAEYNIGDDKFSLMDAAPTYSASPEEFIEKTPKYEYNELLYFIGRKSTREKYQEITPTKPSYIVCINHINDESLDEAKKLEIPIVVIKVKNYSSSSSDFSFFYNENTYKSIKN